MSAPGGQGQAPPAKRQRTGPSASGPAAGSDAETAKRGLVAVNNLRYELPPDLSVVVSRTMHSHFFHTNSYTSGQRMVAQLNSGSAYIDPQNSYLTFDLKVASALETTVTWGNGSAANLFKDVSVIARSGDELERTDQVWSVIPEQDRVQRSTQWFETIGAGMGYNYQRHGPTSLSALGAKIAGVTGSIERPSTDTMVSDSNIAGYAAHKQTLVQAGFAAPGEIALVASSNTFTTGFTVDGGSRGLRVGDTVEINSELLVIEKVNVEPHTDKTGSYNVTRDNWSAPATGVTAHVYVPSAGLDNNSNLSVNQDSGKSTTKRVTIPLSSLSQFFRTTDKLLPAALASGLRFEFQLNNNKLPFVAYGSKGTAAYETDFANPIKDASVAFTIENPRIVCDSYQLTDSIQRAMNETIASSGIEMPFVATHYSSYSSSGQDAHVEVRKAVSRALTVVSKITDATDTGDTDTDSVDTTRFGEITARAAGATLRKYLGCGAGLLEYQARVGSLYFPHQKISAKTSAQAARELYYHTLRGASAAFKRPNTPGSLTWHDFSNTSNSVWTDLERSSVQNLTGIPINNSRVVELAFKSEPGALDSKAILVFLFYVRLVRVFLNNVEVEE